MSQEFEAIFDQGVFRPLSPVDLPDQARVQLQVCESGETTPRETLEATPEELARQKSTMKALLKFAEAYRPATPSEPFSAQDHDLILYGWKK